MVLMQCAFALQLDVPDVHSSISNDKIICKNFTLVSILNQVYKFFINLPVHCSPSPLKPSLQVQTNEPIVLVQIALAWQLSVLRVHSWISIM